MAASRSRTCLRVNIHYLKRDDPFLDALIVGQYEGADLLYKEKVRFGFDDEKKRRILGLMEPLRVTVCPFRNLPERRRRGALDDQQMAEAVWVTPHLRCTVEYTEKTERGNIRGHGRFGEMGLAIRTGETPSCGQRQGLLCSGQVGQRGQKETGLEIVGH